jgi:hypothetical protein
VSDILLYHAIGLKKCTALGLSYAHHAVSVIAGAGVKARKKPSPFQIELEKKKAARKANLKPRQDDGLRYNALAGQSASQQFSVHYSAWG